MAVSETFASVAVAQAIAYLTQASYLFFFPRAFERQSSLLRERPLLCLASGFACGAAWLGLSAAAFKLSLAQRSPLIACALIVPVFVAGSAASTVGMTVIVGRLLRWDPARRAYACLAAAQLLGLAAVLFPRFGVPAVALWACAGLGSIVQGEWRADPAPAEAGPRRLGWPGLASMAGLAAALTLGLWSAGPRIDRELLDLGNPAQEFSRP